MSGGDKKPRASSSSSKPGEKKKKRDASSDSDRATRASSRKEEPPRKAAPSDTRLWLGIGAIALVLAGLVWWSLPGNHAVETIAGDDAAAAAVAEDEDDAGASPRKANNKTSGFDRPSHAGADLSVITNKPDDEIQRIATVSEISKRLDVKYCGGACDAVRKFMSDEDSFEVNIMKADDLILPPKDTLDTVAIDLSPSERETVHERKTAVTVRTQGRIAPEQLPARAAFAATAILADALDGFVYDETSRRIETARTFATHAITVPLGQPAFAPRHVLVQFYRQEDGTARLLTLGMSRFGSPDLSIRNANMSSGPLLAHVINVVAGQIAHGKNESNVTVTLDDIARLLGRKPIELNANAGGARPVELELKEPERVEGDPDNELAELIPKGGSTRESWDLVIASLFGEPTSMATAVNDKELGEVATKARKNLPNAIKRFQAGDGELYVKGPFAIPTESRVDGGGTSELLWIAAASCDAKMCTGTLTNEPSYAMNLAVGKTVSVAHGEAVDWMIQQRDGGTAGGESIKVLRSRVPK